MKIPEYRIIDTAGQWTPIIYGVYSPPAKATIGKKLLAKYPLAGQVAFIDLGVRIPKVSMMGNELSINGTIAAGYLLKCPFITCGLTVTVTDTSTKFPLSIVKSIQNNEVVLTGIKYKLVTSNTKINLAVARIYCGQDEAAGYIIEKSSGEIIPVVYVRATDTLITESACGSASLSYFILTGVRDVTQPSGKTISITKNSATLSISTIVKELYV